MGASATFDFDGVGVVLDGFDLERSRLGDYLEPFRASAVGELTLRLVSEAPTAPSRPPDGEDGPTRVWLGDASMVLSARGWIGSARTGHADIGGTGSVDEGAFGYVAQCCLAWLLASRGRFVLSNVGAVGFEGQAWLVVGPSGRGKSTLVLGAMACGWSGLADETVVVHREGSGVLVAGVHQRLAVPGDVPHPLAVGGQPRGDDRQRVELAHGLLAPGWWPVAGVILVDHADSADAMSSSVGSVECLRALVPAFGATGAEDGARFLSVATVLAALPAIRLAHGRDAGSRLADVAGFLRHLPAVSADRLG